MMPHQYIGAFSMSLISVIASELSTSKGWMTFSAIGSVKKVSEPLTTAIGATGKRLSLNDVSVSSWLNCSRPSGRVVVSTAERSMISIPSCSVSPKTGISTRSFASCVTLRCSAVWSPIISIVESIDAETTIANKIFIIF